MEGRFGNQVFRKILKILNGMNNSNSISLQVKNQSSSQSKPSNSLLFSHLSNSKYILLKTNTKKKRNTLSPLKVPSREKLR